MLAQAGAHFNPTSSRSWSWIRRCRRSWSWSCRHRCHCCFFLLANVAVRQCVSTSVCQPIGQSIITRFGCRRVQIKLVIVPPRSMAAIKYTAHSLSLSLSQSRSQSQSLIPNHSLGLLQTPPPTLPLRVAESREKYCQALRVWPSKCCTPHQPGERSQSVRQSLVKTLIAVCDHKCRLHLNFGREAELFVGHVGWEGMREGAA